jgi:polysaccharide export outer membrane protein
MRGIQQAVFAISLGIWGITFFSSVQAAAPTPAQLQMFQQLSPAQQQALMKQLQGGGQANIQGQPLETPQVVKPIAAPSGKVIQQVAQEGADAATWVEKKESKDVKQKLKQFGYDLFAGAPTTFAPATDIPVPLDYVIGPGDTVEVQLFGKENAQYSLVVSREGRLNFPTIGPISVAGLSFQELKEALQERIKRQMIGVTASITMGPQRSIRIFILGDAQRPGSYTVSALSTMTNALFVGGGIRPIGSLRDIQLKRKGKIITHLDLYDLLLHGDTSKDARLQPGDVIFVPPIGTTIGVAGEVRRPAIYELKDEKKIYEAVAFAGGLLPTAYPKASQLERISPRGDRTLIDIDLAILMAEPSGDFFAIKLKMDDIAYDVLLETGIRIQPLPIWQDEWQYPDQYSNPYLIKNIQREGVAL